MTKKRVILIGLIVLQVVAVVLYPPAFFQADPQAAVLPPTLLLLLALALVGMNTGALTPMAGRVSMVFVQGVNIVVRMMMVFPNLQNSSSAWDWPVMIAMLIGIALSWFAIVQLEKRSPHSLLVRQSSAE